MARRLTREQVISNAYYDINTGFGSISDTLKRAKEVDPSITVQDVRNFMSKQPNRQIRNYRSTNSYTAPFARYQFQMDIMDMVPLTRDPEVKIPTDNGEPRYALVVIDIFSKLANVVPMTNKDGKSVLSALKDSFKKMGHPMVIYSDDDGGFQTVVKEYFNSEGIQHIITRTHANVAERFIRTIKNMIHDRVRFNKAGWTSMLPPALNKYNSTEHSSTKLSPNQAHKDSNNLKVRVNLTTREVNKRKYPELKEGDEVKTFTKGGGNYTSRKETMSKWSKESYTIEKINYDMTGTKTFKLQGMRKPFLRHELLKI